MKSKNQESKIQIVKVKGGIRIKATQPDLKVHNSDSIIKASEE